MNFLIIIPLFFSIILPHMYWFQNVEFSFARFGPSWWLFYFFLNHVKSGSHTPLTNVMTSLISVMFLWLLTPWPGNPGTQSRKSGGGEVSGYQSAEMTSEDASCHIHTALSKADGPAGGRTTFVPSWPWEIHCFWIPAPTCSPEPSPSKLQHLLECWVHVGSGFTTIRMHQPPLFPYPDFWRTPLSSALSLCFPTLKKKEANLPTLWFHEEV